MRRRNRRSRGLTIAALLAIVFGALTIMSGGQALFGDSAATAWVGDAVSFVLWFNFLAGFAYVLAGTGLILRKRSAVWLAAAIALATLAVFGFFGLHIQQGGAYEMRTVGAMTLRSLVWLGIVWIAIRKIGWR